MVGRDVWSEHILHQAFQALLFTGTEFLQNVPKVSSLEVSYWGEERRAVGQPETQDREVQGRRGRRDAQELLPPVLFRISSVNPPMVAACRALSTPHLPA